MLIVFYTGRILFIKVEVRLSNASSGGGFICFQGTLGSCVSWSYTSAASSAGVLGS